jgi:hypothetical protein
MMQNACIKPAVPIGEEDLEVANMRLSITISCIEKEDSKEEYESQSKKHDPCPTSSYSNQS